MRGFRWDLVGVSAEAVAELSVHVGHLSQGGAGAGRTVKALTVELHYRPSSLLAVAWPLLSQFSLLLGLPLPAFEEYLHNTRSQSSESVQSRAAAERAGPEGAATPQSAAELVGFHSQRTRERAAGLYELSDAALQCLELFAHVRRQSSQSSAL